MDFVSGQHVELYLATRGTKNVAKGVVEDVARIQAAGVELVSDEASPLLCCSIVLL